MANEYLTRTPTSSGNRHVFTISFWTKNNVAGGHYFQQRENANSTTQFGISHRTPEDYLRVLMNDGSNVESLNDCLAEMRDFSSWQNIIVAVNTTIDLAEDRVKIYVDGVRRTDFASDSHSDNPAQNFQTSVNDTVRALIGLQRPNSSATLNNSVTAQLTDYFLVDGQALTPDVFGFYKEGKGYQSSGTTRATDFRPGQWVPKAPRTIKSEINRKGGFGVNGFYMPMNDSSNFGADFHCDPNTIIKLKGEDLPQPRNGAPTTTDSYVSQLRSDPYASNLVLAIPGISGGQGSGYGDYSADIKGSGSNKTVTAYGNAGIAVTASYYGSAIRFDGTDDYMEVGSAGESDFNFGSGDFTVEAWMNFVSFGDSPGFGIWDGDNNERQWLIYFNSSGRPRYFTSTDGSGSINIQHNVDHTTNEWIHVAMERNGSTLSGYINGVAVGINTNLGSSSLFTTTDDKLELGRWSYTNTNDGNYFLQDLRIYKGVAKYKGGFDVSKPYTPVGIGTWRAVSDTCKNNFATLNSTSGNESSGQFTFSDGSLTASTTGSNKSVTCNVGMSTGKWYWEYSPNIIIGFHDIGISSLTNPPDGLDDGAISASWRTSTGQIRQGNTNVQATGLSASAGDIVQIAFNASTRRMWVGVNGSYYNNGDPAAGTDSTYQTNLTADTYFFSASLHQSGSTDNHRGIANFGQNPTFSGQVSAAATQRNADSNGKGEFRYEPPTGFLALCEDNLPTPAIADPGENFKCVLWTGDGNAGRSIAGVGFKPDLVWIKERSSTSGHALFDSVRGPGFRLVTNTNAAEDHVSTNVYNPSFNNDGFTIGTDGALNQSGQTYVAWCWKAGGAAVANTDGSINSQVSVNQTAGFSIVSYTGTGANATVGHGLDKTPNIVLCKNRPDVTNWSFNGNFGGLVYGTKKLVLQSDGAILDDTNEVMSANATTFSIGNSTATNGAADEQIAYCWTEIEGFSKFGSYIGNGNADGPFVYCGFKPAWIMVKNIDDTGGRDWGIQDSSRASTNPCNKQLKANQSEVENSSLAASTFQIDMLSNGFKVRNNTGIWNRNGDTMIFMAFAESPFQTANAK